MSSTVEERVVAEIQARFAEFVGYWNAEDIAGWVGVFDHPWSIINPELGPKLIETPDATRQYHAEKMAELHALEWGRTEVDEAPKVYPLADILGHLTTAWTRYDPEGGIIVSGRSFYTFKLIDGVWRIVGLVYNY